MPASQHKDLDSRLRTARQSLAASCRNHLIRIENQARTPQERKVAKPHVAAFQAALDALNQRDRESGGLK